MVFFFVKFVVRMSRVSFVVHLVVMDTFSGECTFPPLVEIRESPEFHDLMREGQGSLATVFALACLASHTF